jgi:signal transduction histidine kinase/DNA-binding response OmpR family regulator
MPPFEPEDWALRMSEHDSVFTGGGELGSLVRGIDWSATALGAVSSWPQSLRSALSICLGSRFPIAIYWGKELVLLYNDAWSPILGEKHPSSLGRPGREVWPEIWDTIGPMFEQVMTTGEATYSEDSILLMHRHGYTEECYFNFTFSPVRGEEGRVEGIFNAVIETTYRVLAERRMRVLRELGERLTLAASTEEVARFAIESLAAAKTDVPFCALYLVEEGAAHATLAASAGVEAGTPFAPFTIALDEDDGPWPLRAAGGARRAHVVTDLKDRFGSPPPGGAWPEPASSAFVVPIALPSSHHASGFLVLGANPRRAIDEQYSEFAEKAGSQLAASIASARRRDEIAAVDRAKTAFFSNVSHEFRTPLTLMLAPIEDLRSLNTADAETRDRVELLHRNALRLLKLVNDLLDFSRIEAGRAVAAYRPTDLAALTADLASTFRSTIERAGLALVVDCPPLGEPVFVDRDLWEKIVLNLLSNSFKFTFDGVITVRLTKEAEAAVLEIRDTGTGISEHEIPRLFERFHRIEGARSRSHEGSGIGLALVHELIRMHGGEIRVESRLGEGTTFFVQIPLGTRHLATDRVLETEERKPFAAAAAIVQEASRWGSSSSPHSSAPSTPRAISTDARARIVLADDNADMRDYVCRLLREQWDVEAVADGHEALAAIRRDPPDLVLSDVMMPGLDGFGLLRAVRNDAVIASTPFVLLSARAGEEAAAEGLRAGADDYIIKPFTARELLVRVMARLSAAKASSAAEEQRKNLYRVLIQAPFPLAVFRGPEHVVELANEAMGKQWGKGPHVAGLPLREAVPELLGQPFLGFLDDVYRTGVEHHGRGELARLGTGPNGALEDHYFNYVYAPLISPRGAVEGVMACAFNVSEQVLAGQRIDAARARAEALASELRITSQRLEAAQRVGSIGIFDWDLRTERVLWSPELYELLGLEPGSVEPSPEAWSERLHEEDRARAWEAFREATAAGRRNFEVEVRLKQPSGQRRWVRLTSSIEYDETGAPLRSLGAVVDIEALKSLADVREAERQRLFSILQQVPATVNFLRGPDLVVEFAHPKTLEALGGRPVIGKPLLAAVPEFREQPYYARLRRVYETGEPFEQHEAMVRLKNGEGEVVTYWDSIYLPVLDGAGAVDGVMTFDLEVTEAVRSRRELEQASRAKDEFLATMSHELRTPLNAMLGWSKILLADSRDPAKVERGLTVIERNARAQARLVDDLMDVSRIVSGKLRLSMRRIQISTVVHAAADVLRATAESKGVRLVVDLDPDVGATVADPDRLQQIIWNLLSNAVRFTPAKGRVSLTAQRSASTFTIEVEDTGAGIAPEHLPHIFERFRQVDSTTTRAHGGLGLGLAIVRHLVEAHGGSVSATSAGLGTGARFTVSLPISAVSLQDEGSPHGLSALPLDPRGTNAPRKEGVRLDGVHVLVVEDELDARELVRLVLESAGARVTTAASAREGLDAPGPFDIILSDIGMPEMDGYDFLRRIRGQSAGASTPALALTAYARAEDAEHARRGGYQQHIAKPVDSVALVEAVRRWTDEQEGSRGRGTARGATRSD